MAKRVKRTKKANPRQTALLELKLAGIRHLAHDDFFALFGEGHHPRFAEMYRDALRADLPDFARAWWDARQLATSVA